MFKLNIPERKMFYTGTVVRPDEEIDIAISRWKNSCRKNGLYDEMEKRKHYQKPSIIKRNKIKERERKKRGRKQWL